MGGWGQIPTCLTRSPGVFLSRTSLTTQDETWHSTIIIGRGGGHTPPHLFRVPPHPPADREGRPRPVGGGDVEGDVLEEGGEVGDEGELVGAEDEGGLLGQVQQPSDHIEDGVCKVQFLTLKALVDRSITVCSCEVSRKREKGMRKAHSFGKFVTSIISDGKSGKKKYARISIQISRRN